MIPFPTILAVLLASVSQTAPAGPASALSGVILDPRGQPVSNAEVALSWACWRDPEQRDRSTRWGGSKVHTGAHGEFELADVQPGYVKVWLAVPGMLPVYIEAMEVEPGRPVTGVKLRSPGYGGRVTGTVADEDGHPVPDAVVTAEWFCYQGDVARAVEDREGREQPARTDASGRFALATVPPGDCTVMAYARGWAPGAADAKVEEGGQATVAISVRRCLPGTWTLSGRVTDQSGTAAGGADIEIDYEFAPGESSHFPLHFITTSLGGCLLYGLPPGKSVSIRVYHPSHGIWEGGVRGEVGEYRGQTWRLERRTALRGVISLGDGTPLRNQTFRVSLSPDADRKPWGALEPHITTDDHGRYEIAGLTPGKWRVTVETERDDRQVVGTVVAGQSTTQHDIVFPFVASVAGRITGPAGQPVPNAWIRFHSGPGRDYGPFRAESGRFRCDAMEPGTYTATAWAAGFWPATSELDLPENTHTGALELRLGTGASISGLVVDAQGQPVPGVPLRLDIYRTTYVDLEHMWSRPDTSAWQQNMERLLETLGCLDTSGVAVTGPGGTFSVRGIAARSVGLVATTERQSWLGGVCSPVGPPEGAVQPCQVRLRRKDGTFAPGGGCIVDLSQTQEVTGIIIRVAKAVPDEDLCRVRGSLRDPRHRLPGIAGTMVLLSESPFGYMEALGEGHRLRDADYDAATVSADGTFEVRNVVAGTYTVLAGGQAGSYQIAHLRLNPGQTVDVGELAIPSPGAIEGTVLDAKGRPVGEGIVLAARQESDLSFWAAEREKFEGERRRLHPDGSFHLGPLAEGFWYLMPVSPSQPISAIKRVFVNGDTAGVDFRHLYTDRIVGRLTDLAGKPLLNGRVRCSAKNLQSAVEAVTDEQGRYEIASLPPGFYTLTPDHPWCFPVPGRSVRVEEDEALTTVDFAMERGGYIQAKLIRPDGLAVRGSGDQYLVQAGPPWTEEPSAWLMPDGTIRSRLLRPGSYLLRARPRDAPVDAPWLESELVGVYLGEATTAAIELPRR